MPTPNSDLELLRLEIEEINQALLELLNRRAGVALAIQRVKSRDGIPTRVPAREQAMLEDLARRNRGPFSDEAVGRVFREILRASVALMERQKLRVLSRDEALDAAANS
jgi:3-deoxy-7-phosphoheptulonate synthase / chorismate mutase